jgi:ubiquinone/menaquinone biosynthesis C-methylase UbiE
MLFTLCFLTSPETALAECFRVLRSKGILLLGFIPAHSPWGRSLAAKRDKQHPYYRYICCRTVAETRQLLDQAGFFILRGYSTLYQNPEAVSSFEEPQSGLDEKAGFCVLTATRRKS